MKSNYKQLGTYIREVVSINTTYGENNLRGISSIYKRFNKSKANIVGVDFLDYKIVGKNKFAFNPNTARMGDKIPIALNYEDDIIVSKIYPVFEIIDQQKLLPEYLLMWFKRAEFDRYARFKSHGSAREIFNWEEMCNVSLPIPHPVKQREIIKEYKVIVNRIELNNRLINKLEETAQAIYKQWFVDFEFPDKNGKPYKSNGGKMIDSEFGEIPLNWEITTIEDVLTLNYGKALPEGGRTNGKIKVYSSAGHFGFCNKALVEESSVIVGRKGNVGTVFYEKQPTHCIDTAYFIKGSECDLPLIFIYYLLRQLNLSKRDEDSAVPGLNRNTVYGLKVLKPEGVVLQKYENVMIKLNDYITVRINENNKLEVLKNILLSKLATIED